MDIPLSSDYNADMENNETLCEGCGSTDLRSNPVDNSGLNLCIECAKDFEDFLDNLFVDDTDDWAEHTMRELDTPEVLKHGPSFY